MHIPEELVTYDEWSPSRETPAKQIWLDQFGAPILGVNLATFIERSLASES